MPCAFSSPAGCSTSVFDAPTLLRMCSGFQSDLATATIACAENFGVVMLRNVSAPESASFDTCERDRRVRDLVALLGDDLDVRALDRLLEAAQQVLAEGVVLVEHRDLRVRLLLLQVVGVDLRLGHVVGLPADRERVRLDVRAPVATRRWRRTPAGTFCLFR